MGRHAAERAKPAGTTGTRTSALRGAGVGAAAGLVVIGLGVVGVATGVIGGDDSPTEPRSTPSASTPASSEAAPERRKRTVVKAAVRPTGLTVPALGLRAEVLPIEVDPDGVLDPPADVSQVGWWQRSARMGATSGQTVLTGHAVQNDGGGVMDELERLSRGDKVKVLHKGTVAPYTVTSTKTWSKEKLADKAVDIFSQDRRNGRLVLISCEDWNGTSWDSNVVVFAKPAYARG